MDIFIQHFKSDWRIDITKLDAKLLNIHQICRICFTTVNISPIAEMKYEEITMINIMKSFLPLELDPMDMVPYNLCSGCTNQLVQFYTFRENWKLSEELLSKEKIFIDELNLDLQTVIVSNYSDSEEVLDNSVKKTRKRKQPSSQYRKSRINKLVRKRANRASVLESMNTNRTEIKESSTDVEAKECKRIPEKYVKKFKCIECKDEYETQELLRKHCNETLHVNRNDCSAFNKKHINTHKKEKRNRCDDCTAAFSTKKDLVRHKMVHTRKVSFTCTFCGFAYGRQASLTIHIRNQHEGNNSIEATTTETLPTTTEERYFNRYTCKECGRIFKRRKSFHFHIQEHKELRLKYSLQTKNFNDSTENSIENSNDSNKNITTIDNNLETSANTLNGGLINDQINNSQNSDVSTLMFNNLNEMAFTCDKCGRGYTTYPHLKQHLVTHGDKKYLCSDCGRGFTTTAALSSHRKVHTREKPYQCTVCPKQFAHSGTLEMHMNMHTGNKPYRCDVCLKQFSQRAHLSYHMLLHSGQKSHVCSFCNRAFTLKGNLTVHMRTHTGETPYLCDVCGRGFYDSSSRKRHRKGHSEEEEVIKATGMTEIVLETSVETVTS